MNIRRAVIEDFEGILNLQLQLEETEIQFDDNLREKCYATNKGMDKLKNRICDEKNIFYVAINRENTIIGFIDGRVPNDEWWYKETVAYLNHICVSKNYRRKGIAIALLQEFEKAVKNKDAKYIRVLAFSQNYPAISFYMKNGFIEYSTYYNKILK